MILVRATLPRMRYDRLMNFGWKVLIPFGLLWIMATGMIVVLPDRYGRVRGSVIAVGIILALALLLSLLAPVRSADAEREAA